MKKLVLTLIVTGVIAVPAFANHQDESPAGVQFDNRGQCQAALIHWRNTVRDRRGNDRNRETNEFFRDERECRQNPDGTWQFRAVR